MRFDTLTGVLLGCLVVTCGCSQRPSPIKPVDVDPGGASAAAMEQYDKNTDGQLDDDELKALPGVAKYKDLYDLNGDGAVDRDEFQERLRAWKKGGLGFRQLPVVVMLDGKPLMNAEVEFIPEPYLQPAVKPSRGITSGDGTADMSVSVEDMPSGLPSNITGVTGGTFKVKVTHPDKTLPAKYNTETELGEEIASDTVHQRATIELSTR